MRQSRNWLSRMAAILIFAGLTTYFIGANFDDYLFQNVGDLAAPELRVAGIIVGGLGGLLLLSLFRLGIADDAEAMKRRLEAFEREDAALSRIAERDGELATLLDYNRQQILRYHRIVTEQAEKSFRAGQIASGVGLLIVLLCFVCGLRYSGGDVKWFSGAVAAIGGSLSTFVNRTYMRMYDKATAQLVQFFDQPVLDGFYLTAERISNNRDLDPELKRAILDEVLAKSHLLGMPKDVTPARAKKQRKPKPRSSQD